MIRFSHVSKEFGNRVVLNNINLKLPRTGLITIIGPSGCGKTTLLNLLSGLLPFDGDIEIDGHHIGLMSQKDMDEYRLKNFGFVFQDFKLFEFESVINNIMFPLETANSCHQETKMKKCHELINLVGLKRNAKQRVNKLSGGEKQRVAIARALVNGPKIILADEPTGALDSKTSQEIMKLLEVISKKSLVVMVTHDKDIAKKYADQIIEMKDGEILKVKHQTKKETEKYVPISRLYQSQKKPSIPSSFLLHHTINSIKQKKWRTMICNSVTSLGLIGIGLATSLSTSISSNIKKSYSQIIDDSKITIAKKNTDQTIYGQYAASYYEVMDLADKYQKDIYDIGVTYHNPFESFFPQTNCIALADTTYYTPIQGLSVRHINEFKWLDVEPPETIYPEPIDYLRNDQVVLALTIDMIQQICFNLRIERTVTSLSHYLQTNELKIYFDLRNDYWQYSDQQIVQVVGFSLEKTAGIYHYNHLWNEHMFEERMRFPTSDNIGSQTQLPWALKKIYYFYIQNDVSSFLAEARRKEEFEPYILEIANKTYYPWLYKEKSAKDISRVLIFANTLRLMPAWYFNYIQDVSDEVEHPVFGSYGGYAIYPSSMMYGFANYMYFSGNTDSLEETIDINTTLTTEVNESIELPTDVLSGHYSQSISGGVNFNILDQQVINGRAPKDLTEIVISSRMAKVLFPFEDALNKEMHIAYLSSQTIDGSGNVIRTFKTTSINVVGIIDSDKNAIYHNEDWTIGFFQIMLDVSAFNLGINALMVDVKNQKKIDKVVEKLKRAFPDYEISEPMSEINKSVNQVCTYIQIALSCFSVIAVIISSMLLSICNYLYVLENKKDIGLARCIGVNKKEARKFVLTHSVIMCLISFVLSSIELFVVSLVISSEMARQMNTTFSFSFEPMALIYMFALAFFISIASSFVIAHRLNKLDPLSALKQ